MVQWKSQNQVSETGNQEHQDFVLLKVKSIIHQQSEPKFSLLILLQIFSQTYTFQKMINQTLPNLSPYLLPSDTLLQYPLVQRWPPPVATIIKHTYSLNKSIFEHHCIPSKSVTYKKKPLHLSRGTSGCQPKCTLFLTPLSGAVFQALSHGVIFFRLLALGAGVGSEMFRE